MTVSTVTAAEEGGNILLPAAYDLIWGTVSFLVIAFVVYKFAWPAFSRMLDQRATLIEDGLEAADRAKAEVAAERQELAHEIDEARKEASRIREEASANAKGIVADAKEKAISESERVLANANRQMEADRATVAESLRSDVGSLATELASRIVGENVADNDLTRRVVDRFLDELEQQATKQDASVEGAPAHGGTEA